jgi:hypothetical protein
MLINHTQLPQFDIDLSQLNDAYEIKGIMKKIGVTVYVYAFVYRGTVMKYGQSCYKTVHRSDPNGERIYRQARYINGWHQMPATTNSSGSDIIPVLDHFPQIHKDQVSIHVWDMTDYPFAAQNCPEHEVTVVENQLIEAHISATGYKPFGNIKDEAHIKSKAIVTDTVFNNLFESA